jgi:hypothetical protein
MIFSGLEGHGMNFSVNGRVCSVALAVTLQCVPAFAEDWDCSWDKSQVQPLHQHQQLRRIGRYATDGLNEFRGLNQIDEFSDVESGLHLLVIRDNANAFSVRSQVEDISGFISIGAPAPPMITFVDIEIYKENGSAEMVIFLLGKESGRIKGRCAPLR